MYTTAVIQNEKELRNGEMTLEDTCVELPLISPDTTVSNAIDKFQECEQELALITESDETPVKKEDVMGLVTATDAFEVVSGELEDPFDS